jgi:hypothetical protein
MGRFFTPFQDHFSQYKGFLVWFCPELLESGGFFQPFSIISWSKSILFLLRMSGGQARPALALAEPCQYTAQYSSTFLVPWNYRKPHWFSSCQLMAALLFFFFFLSCGF